MTQWCLRGFLGQHVVSLLVGIVLEDMVPAGCLLCLAVPGDRALKQLFDSKTGGDLLISGLTDLEGDSQV